MSGLSKKTSLFRYTLEQLKKQTYRQLWEKGIEAMNMIKKRQVNNLNYAVLNEVKYINQLFGIVL